MPAPIIKTKRLILRHWEDTDLPPFAAMNADPTIMEYFPIKPHVLYTKRKPVK